MEIALIISLIALFVALPGCIADSLTVIEKIRARRAQRLLTKSKAPHARLEGRNLLRMLMSRSRHALLKKSEVRHADQSFVFPKKADVARPRVLAASPAQFTASGLGNRMVSKPDLVTFGGHSPFKKNNLACGKL